MDHKNDTEETRHELLTRGVEEVIGQQELEQKLLSGKKLRVKLGIDPTSPHLHLGRSVPLLKLRDFQMLGHTIVFIVGDFTGVIGDTSDKESERPMLSTEQITTNKERYFEQVGKLIDLERAEFRYNSEWLSKLTYGEIGMQADQFSVADFIARDNIKKRLNHGKRVSLREVLYPLMQGYDSVVVEADIEVGGTDQRFNLLAGRTLQAHAGQVPQSIITNPLIPGLDGRKMSSSWGNTINLDDAPEDMYGKVMRLRDELVVTYFTLCTRISLAEVATFSADIERGSLHPRDLKMRLAREIVSLYHGNAAAQDAEDHFIAVFQNKETPTEAEEITANAGELVREVLVRNAVLTSNSEWRRLIAGNGVFDLDRGESVTAPDLVVKETVLLRLGKRRFVRIICS